MSDLKVSKRLKISFEDIVRATNSFENRIGQGGYGRVFKGELLISGRPRAVAVKRLYKQFGQGSKEFLTEIDLLCGQKHPNLISLLGYCDEGIEKIIVYEYAERGSLDQYLRHHDTTYTLTWPERLKICVGIARGLDHLHNHSGKHQTIIHRDIKSSNILVDDNWVAKISDLGLSKLSLAGLGRSAIISYACGTPGYCEPEYIASGIVTKESDVYSFGMVLLEIICGRLCTIVDDKGYSLLDYYKKNHLDEVIVPSVMKQMTSYSKDRFLTIIYGCLRQDRRRRYPIHRVVTELEELQRTGQLFSGHGKRSKYWRSNFPTLLSRRTNVGKIFDMFDLNRDGGLSRQELATFLVVTNFNVEHGAKQVSAYVDKVLCLHSRYIDGKKGLTYHGLLEYYEDGDGDLDSDIARVLSDSYSEDDDLNRRQMVMTIFKKLNSDKDDSHGLLKLALNLKPNNDDEADLYSSPEGSVVVKPLTYRPIRWWIMIILLILLITTIFVKLSYIWFLFLILSNSANVIKNKFKKMH